MAGAEVSRLEVEGFQLVCTSCRLTVLRLEGLELKIWYESPVTGSIKRRRVGQVYHVSLLHYYQREQAEDRTRGIERDLTNDFLFTGTPGSLETLYSPTDICSP